MIEIWREKKLTTEIRLHSTALVHIRSDIAGVFLTVNDKQPEIPAEQPAPAVQGYSSKAWYPVTQHVLSFFFKKKKHVLFF